MRTLTELRNDLREAERRGWTVERTGRDHVRLRPPEGLTDTEGRLVRPLYCGSTTGRRAIDTLRGQMRKYGAINGKDGR